LKALERVSGIEPPSKAWKAYGRRFPPWSIDEGMGSFIVKDAAGQPKILPRLRGRFILHKSLNQSVRPNQREGV
jgi:hypothetical protein